MAFVQSGMRLTPAALNDPSAYKTSDTSRSSTTTLTADPNLVVSVVANAVYVLSAFIPHTYDPACDFKCTISGPSGASMPFWTAWWRTTDGNNIAGAMPNLGSVLTITSGSGTTVQPLWAQGVLTVGATAGSVAFEWAQNTSSVNAATVKAGALLRLERIG